MIRQEDKTELFHRKAVLHALPSWPRKRTISNKPVIRFLWNFTWLYFQKSKKTADYKKTRPARKCMKNSFSVEQLRLVLLIRRFFLSQQNCETGYTNALPRKPRFHALIRLLFLIFSPHKLGYIVLISVSPNSPNCESYGKHDKYDNKAFLGSAKSLSNHRKPQNSSSARRERNKEVLTNQNGYELGSLKWITNDKI